MSEMILVSTTFTVSGKDIQRHIGPVKGIVVRTPTISQGIMGGLTSILGGKIQAYTDMCEQARGEAYNLMIRHAVEMGANAVIGMRYDASEVVAGATEVLCYGTAVVVA